MRNLADVQRGLLNVEVQRQVQTEWDTFEKEMGDLYQKHLNECQRKDEVLKRKLEFFEDTFTHMNDFINAFGGWWNRAREDLLQTVANGAQVQAMVAEGLTAADQTFKDPWSQIWMTCKLKWKPEFENAKSNGCTLDKGLK